MVGYCAAKPSDGISPPGPSRASPRLSFLVAGSAAGVTVTFGGFTVLSTTLTAHFQAPKIAWGVIGVPANCQSPERLVGTRVMSVMNNAGHIGRSDRSVPA